MVKKTQSNRDRFNRSLMFNTVFMGFFMMAFTVLLYCVGTGAI